MNPPILSPPMPVLRGHAGPNHLTSLRFSDGRQRVVLDGELPQVGDCVEVLGTVAVNGTGDVFSVRLPGGGGNVTLANLLQLRASPQAAPLQAGPADPGTPQPGQPTHTSGDGGLPRFTFFVHDHLENSRVLYANKLAGCGSAQARYVLEHVLDYYPYGRTLREHAVAWERFQTTHHERDPETGLDYRGARFYDGDVPRFLSTDPKAADFAAWSTYNYVLGNPVRLVDPDGRSPEPSEHYTFLTGRGLDIYLYARSQGASIYGALTVLGQAGHESTYGKNDGAIYANNYFGVMGAGNGYSKSDKGTAAGRFRNYPTFQEGIADYFEILCNSYTGVLDLLYGNDFSTDQELYDAFRIGNRGWTSGVEYGKLVLGATRAVVRRITGDLTIYIDQLDKWSRSFERRMDQYQSWDYWNASVLSGYAKSEYIWDFAKAQQEKEEADAESERAGGALKEINSIIK